LGSRIFLEQGRIAGLTSRLLDIAVDWDIVRQEINGTKVPAAIIGEHWYGINSGAKNSLDKNYLLQAEKTEYVNIIPLHIAIEISEMPGYGYQIICNQINEQGETIAQKSITCRYLFLAAGSIGTSKLLVKAKATGTLPRLNEYVGLEWGGNGDTLSVRSGLPQPTNPNQGGPAVAAIEYFDNPLGPISITGAGAVWNAPDGTITSLSMSIPSKKGKFRYDQNTGLVNLIGPGDDDLVMKTAKFAYKLIDRKNVIANQALERETSLGSVRPRRTKTSIDMLTLSAHPLGGAVLGKACDLYGRIRNYTGLYVIDSALIPGSTGCVNPSLTIAALAERNIERILTEDLL
jgi:cholesterol oxidase